MGVFSCFRSAEEPPVVIGPEDRARRTSKEMARPLAPSAAAIQSVPAPAPAPKRVEELLEQAQSEIQSLTSRLQQAQSEQGSKLGTSTKELARLESLDKEVTQAHQDLVKAGKQVQDLESQVTELKLDLTEAQQSLQASEQACQQLQLQLQATHQELKAAQDQASSHAAAIDDLYLQTSSFLQTQGVPVGRGTSQQGPYIGRATTEVITTTQARVRSVGDQQGVAGAKTELQQTIQDLVSQRQELETKCQALARQVEVLQLERASVQQAYEQAFDQGQGFREEILRLEHELAEAKAATVAAPVAAVALDRAVSDNAANGSTSQLEEQLRQLTQANQRLTEDARTIREAAETAKQEAAFRQTSLQEVHAMASARETEVTDTLTALTAAHKKEISDLKERLAQAEAKAGQATEEATQLRGEVASHSFTAEGTAGQVDMLLREITTLKKRYAALEADMRLKDEMMGLLQTQLAEVADVDLDGALVTAAMTRPPPLPPARSNTNPSTIKT